MSNFRAKCEVCGQFVSWKDVEYAVYYGGHTDLEPPDGHYYCPRCAEINKNEAVERGRVMDVFYSRPAWHIEAEKIISEREDK